MGARMGEHTPVPTAALRLILDRASTRAHDHDEERALALLRDALDPPRRNHCRDDAGHATYCHVCTADPCPHGRHGGI